LKWLGRFPKAGHRTRLSRHPPAGALSGAPSPAQWWLARYQAISLLKGNAPRLFEALTAHYRVVTGRAAGT